MDNTNESVTNYQLLALEDGFKYEQIDNYIIKREDINAKGIKKINLSIDAFYDANKKEFIINDKLKANLDNFIYHYKDIKLKIKLSSHHHIGVFPEQKRHWDKVSELIKNSNQEIKVLNLFSYTGAASINAALAGASEIVSVDALKQINDLAKENSKLSNSDHLNMRYITDDVIKFLIREIKRGNKYQIVIMDPPAFGRGPKNEIWKFDKDIETLLSLVNEVLKDPLAIIISVYTKDYSKDKLYSLLSKYYKATIKTYNMSLLSNTNQKLACGVGGICEF